ncbi:hypothetical protein [Nocardia gamkensis]|uniref:hypothetical protein n=1 Tax=Nocardia gamkensis TaxID=352869 RepID=UPI0037C6AC6A
MCSKVSRRNCFAAACEADGDILKVNDANGYTQSTHSVYLTPACEDSHPEPAPSQPSGKTVGWIALQIQQPNPMALVYSPYVFADGATLESLDLIKTAPVSTVIKLPNPLSGGERRATSDPSAHDGGGRACTPTDDQEEARSPHRRPTV